MNSQTRTTFFYFKRVIAYNYFERLSSGKNAFNAKCEVKMHS